MKNRRRLLRRFAKGFKKGAKSFGMTIGAIVNTILLLIVYIFGIGITSVVAKISNRRLLEKDMSKSTYWQDLELKNRPKEKYYRQF